MRAAICSAKSGSTKTNACLLQTARVMAGGQELWYNLPIPYNAGEHGRGWHFVLVCKFIETRHHSSGERVFGINLHGLQVLTGIDPVAEAGFATVYDEEIEFRLDTENWQLWVTSVGKLRVRIDQSVPFSFEVGALHVGITPEAGNARLCGLQVIQGTLEELHEERYRRVSADKRPKIENASDHVEEEGNAVSYSISHNVGWLSATLLVLIMGTVTQLGVWPDHVDPHHLQRNQTTRPSSMPPQTLGTPAQQAKRLSTAGKEARSAERSALLLATRRERELTETGHAEESSTTRSAARAPQKVATRVDVTEGAARRLAREQRKQQRLDKGRLESLRAEALALRTADEVRRKAKKKSADAFAALQEIERKEKQDARDAQQLVREKEAEQKEAAAAAALRRRAKERQQEVMMAQAKRLRKQREEATLRKTEEETQRLRWPDQLQRAPQHQPATFATTVDRQHPTQPQKQPQPQRYQRPFSLLRGEDDTAASVDHHFTSGNGGLVASSSLPTPWSTAPGGDEQAVLNADWFWETQPTVARA
jgi:hypothetical protein